MVRQRRRSEKTAGAAVTARPRHAAGWERNGTEETDKDEEAEASNWNVLLMMVLGG